ncbi:MAG: cytochrome C [Aquabacterium sp.]|nr:cytochrome C [Aquabacterium sp.]
MTLFTLPLSPRAATIALSTALLAAGAAPAAAQGRGELLYTTHCIACHDTQVHWRSKKQVVDWPSLRAQVRAWQATGQLGWTDEDILQVAAYLNEAFYHLPPPAPMRSGTKAATGLALAAVAPASVR